MIVSPWLLDAHGIFWRMLSAVIPTLNAAKSLPATIQSLCGDELDLEIVIADGGSDDGGPAAAMAQGARIIDTVKGRGHQLAAGAAAAKGDWLMFVHADTRLSGDWQQAAARFMSEPTNLMAAAYFNLFLNDDNPAARRIERLAGWRARTLGLPYGDQGLLLSRQLYDEVGGYKEMVMLEDIDIVRRIGRRRLTQLDATARTSAERYQRDGYIVRPMRNLFCVGLYYLGVPAGIIRRIYS